MEQNMSLSMNTRNYTLFDIKAEVMEDFRILESLGHVSEVSHFEIEWMKSTRILGQVCKRLVNGVPHLTIRINEPYLRIAPPMEVHNTIMHECIHCMPGCLNHGPTWKAIGAQVNANFKFNKIQRVSPHENLEPIMREAKYKIHCSKCGWEAQYKRKTKAIAYLIAPDGSLRYSCPKCGETLSIADVYFLR